jgi:hypothetical protein
VMHDGKLADVLPIVEATRESIGRLMLEGAA